MTISSINTTQSYSMIATPQEVAPTTAASTVAEAVITIERGSGIYESYLKNGVMTKLQYIGASEAKAIEA